MAEKWYLRIDGIDGASTAKGQEQAIDVVGWSWSVTQGATYASGTGSGVGAAGKPSFKHFDIAAYLSQASPALVISCATGTHHQSAELTGVRTGAKEPFVTYRLSDVLVARVDHADDEDGTPVEEFSLLYGQFEMTYTPQKASGQAAPPIHVGYDVFGNKKL